MNAIALLKNDHREVENLFSRYSKFASSARIKRDENFEKIAAALMVHTFIEESVLYPRIKGFPELKDDVLESLEEHHLIKIEIQELSALKASDEEFEAKIQVLMENVRHHVAEEEKEWFPEVMRRLSRSELNELGAELENKRKSAPTYDRGSEAKKGTLTLHHGAA